jgi:transposase
MGRPSKLTPETAQKITAAIAAGNYLEVAAAHGGIVYGTLNTWMRKGAAANSGQYREFYEAVKRAEADAEMLRIARISKAGSEGNWQADAWYLERRYPDRWGRRTEVSGPGGGPIALEVIEDARERVVGRIDSIAARLRAEGDDGEAGDDARRGIGA